MATAHVMRSPSGGVRNIEEGEERGLCGRGREEGKKEGKKERRKEGKKEALREKGRNGER